MKSFLNTILSLPPNSDSVFIMAAQASQGKEKPTHKCDQCEKPFSSKPSLTRHIKTIHDGIVNLKNLFTTPKALPNQKRLFTSVPNLSTQGNSAGQVNNPKVRSEGEYLCGTCDKTFPTQNQATNHMTDVHDKANAANDDTSSENSMVEENTEDYNVRDEADDEDMAKLVDDYEDDILAEELARLANVVEAVNLKDSKCSECNNLSEVLAHKESVIKNLDKKANTLKARQMKSDEMKKKITKDKKKLSQENVQLKMELKQSNDMLAEQLKKVSALH